jgi:hypothetical protein
LLQVSLAMLITLAAGPEIFLAMEMTTLLEILGASLFLTAYGVGAKLFALTVCRALLDIALPAAQVSILCSRAPASAKASAALYILFQTAGCLLTALVIVMAGQHLLTQ